MGEILRKYSSPSTLYFLGHKPIFPGEREQIKNIREKERQLLRGFTFSAIFPVLKPAYEEGILMSVIRQIDLQTLSKLSVEFQAACISTSLGSVLGLSCHMAVI